MLNRQRVLLAFICAGTAKAGRGPTKIQLTKFAFLFRQFVGTATGLTYEFVPYKFGPFSFALYREMDSLAAEGLVCLPSADLTCYTIPKEAEARAHAEVEKLPRLSWPGIRDIGTRYGALNHDKLLRTVYDEYPWFAQNSERQDLVSTPTPPATRASAAAYTVGYEGKCIDGFLAGLLRAGMHRIIDVRRNPISRKYGFAKSTLSRSLEKLGIEYTHIPELGIPSEERRELSSPSSYQLLLNRYENHFLPKESINVRRVAELLREKPSALLCMERDAATCHRSRLAANAASVGKLEVSHLL